VKHVPNHPYASYHIGTDDMGRVYIKCVCAFCGGVYERRCHLPSRATAYVLKFAQIHGHGLSPRLRTR